jgi:hypothetical protein
VTRCSCIASSSAAWVFGGRAVDFVGEHDVREDGTGREHHLPPSGRRIFLNDVRAGDVRRHQVRRELDAVELEVEDLRQRPDQQRLRQSGHADDQAVAADEQRQQNLVHHLLLADDQLAELANDLLLGDIHLVGQRDVLGRIHDDGFLLYCAIHEDLSVQLSARVSIYLVIDLSIYLNFEL